LAVLDHSSKPISEYSPTLLVKTAQEPLTGENLHKAILANRQIEIENILNTADALRIIEIPDKNGNTPLMNIVIHDHVDLVEMFVTKGANINTQNEAGKTALMIACFYHSIPMIKELRNNGAKYELRDRNGCTALHYACDGANFETVRYVLMEAESSNIDLVNLTDTSLGWSPLLRNAAMGMNSNNNNAENTDIPDLLIKFKANVNLLDYEKKSALMIAVINGNLGLTQLLINNGADVTIRNEFGKTIYDMASSMSKTVRL